MIEKKIQENPLPEEHPPELTDKPKDMPKPADKTTEPVPPPVPEPTPRVTVPPFTKTPPNDLPRKLLPAVLFLMTFVTVMTMLLIYMDTVALGAHKFRQNMSRDYELASIPQDSLPLVSYVREVQLSPGAPRAKTPAPPATPRALLLLNLTTPTSRGLNGTLVEMLPRGPRDPTTWYLEAVAGWEATVARAAARDYLALRGVTTALHACLSPTPHPREVTYHDPENPSSIFKPRVLCLPVYTVLLAAQASTAQYVLLGGEHVLTALKYVPFDKVTLQVIEVRTSDPMVRNATTEFLSRKHYTVAATYDNGIMYALNRPKAPQ